jgi:hypothetical protein
VPDLTPEQEHATLERKYDTPILVRRIDGTVRLYRPDEWPPAGGVGHGSRVIATMVDGGFLWASLDGGPWEGEPEKGRP